MSTTRTTSPTPSGASNGGLRQGISRRQTLKAGAGVLDAAALPIFRQQVPLANGAVSVPVTAPVRSGLVEAFGRGSDKALHHNWQLPPGNAWSGWSSLGGVVDQPAIGRNGDGRLEAFVVGNDHALWHNWQVNPERGVERLGVPGRPGSTNLRSPGTGDGRLEALVIGSDHALWHRWQLTPGGGDWSGWTSLGGWIDQLAVDVNA